MAITVNTLAVGHYGFMLNADSADISGVEVLLAAQGAGTRIRVDFLRINSTGNISITLGEGETVPGALDADLIGPTLYAAGQTLDWDLRGRGGMPITDNTLLAILGSGAGQVSIFAHGRII